VALHIVTERNFSAEHVSSLVVIPAALPAGTAAPTGNISFPHAAIPSGRDIHQGQSVQGTSSFELGVTGLVNLGNTCYINTIIQCFLSLSPIRNYYISDLFLQNLRSTGNQKNKHKCYQIRHPLQASS
jgi:ubiquitin C-terminal hydrolase